MNQALEDPSDLELMKRFQGGDKEAFRLIYARYYRYVRYYCAKLVKNEKSAEDLAQDTFMKVLTKSHLFHASRSGTCFKAWLTCIAFNLTMTFLGRKNRRRELNCDVREEEDLAVSRERPADEKLVQRELVAVFWRVAKDLPEPVRQCFICHYVLGIKYADLGRVYGLRPHQVAHRVAVGRNRLAEELRLYQ